jgi:hypothetical protein
MGVILRSAVSTCRGYRALDLNTRGDKAANISMAKSSRRPGAIQS